MKRSKPRGKLISLSRPEEVWKILEESDGEDNLMEELENSHMCDEISPACGPETIDSIRDFIDHDYYEEPAFLTRESVVNEQPSTSSPVLSLPPLFEIDDPVLPVPNIIPDVRQPAVLPVPRVVSRLRESVVLPLSRNEETTIPLPRIESSNQLPIAWDYNIRPLQKEVFTGYDQLKRQIIMFSANSDLWTIFCSIIDDEIIDFMVHQTNIYAAQLLQLRTLKQNSRLKRWKDVTANEMRKFIGVYLLTGVIDFPTTVLLEKDQTVLPSTSSRDFNDI